MATSLTPVPVEGVALCNPVAVGGGPPTCGHHQARWLVPAFPGHSPIRHTDPMATRPPQACQPVLGKQSPTESGGPEKPGGGAGRGAEAPLLTLNSVQGLCPQQKHDPGLIAGAAFSDAPGPAQLQGFQGPLHLGCSRAHQRSQRKPLKNPFPSCAPPPPQDQCGTASAGDRG